MLFENLLNQGSMPVLEKVMSFTQQRQQVLANNISNFDTPGYKMKDVPEAEFFESLSKAVEKRDKRGAGSLELSSSRHLSWDRKGNLQVKALDAENSNILFHDENNRFVEKQMSMMSKNALLHNVSAELLRGQYETLQMAIRGRV
ncbi:MAG: flagellar basal body rod protein FlgB [Sedimentisphaerales bacterium]|nr:flagellar basal body rod protein FlgB [Sedimentisphaerales bacterium]